jgi:hypothetical protein
MGVRRVEELVAYQLSLQFKRRVYALVRTHSQANRDLRYRDQLFDATSGVPARSPRGSAGGPRGDSSHFSAGECVEAFTLGRRSAAAIAGLQRSLRPFLGHEQRCLRSSRAPGNQTRNPGPLASDRRLEPGSPQTRQVPRTRREPSNPGTLNPRTVKNQPSVASLQAFGSPPF